MIPPVDAPPALRPIDPTESAEALAALGASLATAYAAAQPFKHIRLSHFLEAALLDGVLKDIASMPLKPAASFDRAQERLKVSYNPDILPAHTRQLFQAFNAQPFVAFLQKLTGIPGLIPDPHFLGGGIHEIKNGGHLDIHADFNFHPILRTERRINVLIYLNKDWQPSYGGQLELWDKQMRACVSSFDPVFNDCVIFDTDSDSFHGNPHPVNHPEGKNRFSIALYYYTATWDESKRGHTTKFKVRPKSKDRFDWKITAVAIVNDLMPPAVMRWGKRAAGRLRK